MTSGMSPSPQTPYFLDFAWWMYGNALWQWQQQQYAAAILLSQVAVEMGARNAFIALLVRHHGAVDNAFVESEVPDFSFMKVGTRRLWTVLTGESVTTEPKAVWRNYHAHVERRNRIAHGLGWGDANGGRDAHDSWAAAGAFIARLDSTMQRVDANDDPPQEA